MYVWSHQSLSANYATPITTGTPIVLLHSGPNGNLDRTSVFTIDATNGHLDETFLNNARLPGDAWQTQDLSAEFGTPPATS